MGAYLQVVYALLLLLGGLIAIIGILIFIFRKRSGKGNIEILSFRFGITNIVLVMLLTGCLLMIIAGMKVSDTYHELSASLSKSTNVKADTRTDKKALNSDTTLRAGTLTTKENKKDTIAGQSHSSNTIKKYLTNSYPNSLLAFCAKLDENGAGYDFSNDFTLETKPDYVYVALNNQGIPFTTSKITFYVYKKMWKDYQLQYTLPVFIDPLSTYFYQQIFFDEPGTYQVKAFDADEHYITTGYFTLQE